MSELTTDFQSLPEEYQHVIHLAQEKGEAMTLEQTLAFASG